MPDYANPNDSRRIYDGKDVHHNLPMIIAHSTEVVGIYGGAYGIEYLMNPEARNGWNESTSGVYHKVCNERFYVDPNSEESEAWLTNPTIPRWLEGAELNEGMEFY